jgi:phenylpyruvate tautomerase PptA (4-oxalocrotonate tautomerase family)
MPIVTVQPVVGDAGGGPSPQDVQALADRLGELFSGQPGSTWIKVNCLSRSHYAEDRSPLPAAVRPVFVEVLKRSLPERQRLALEADRVAQVVAEVLGRTKENIHVLYLPPGEGRIAFGGRLLGADD